MKQGHSSDVHLAHGEVLGACEVAGIVLSETAYRPALHIAPHSHEEEAYFNFVLQGGFTERRGRRTYELHQSTLIYHAAGEVRSNRFHNQTTRLFNARLNAGWLDTLSSKSLILDASNCLTDRRLTELAVRLYREFKNLDTASSLVVEGITLEMLGLAARESQGNASPHAPRWLALVQDMLHAKFHESLRLSDIAASAGVHPAHLSRAFRQHFRCTLGDYVRRLRVEYACRQLAASQTSLTDVASAAGFADQSHFTRVFKRFTGQTPAQYRGLANSR
jgi:AraC family transcriptional regulator